MKKIFAFISALALMANICAVRGAEYEVKTRTLKQGALGTLNSSGVSYEAKITIPGYIGRLDTTLNIDGEEVETSVAVVMPEGSASVEVSLMRFDGYVIDASLKADRYLYTPGAGFETQDKQVGKGSSGREGGSLDLGRASGLYSGRVIFYYSTEELSYKSIDDVPIDKWGELYWFNLGSSYILRLDEKSLGEFMETGELDGYSWPGLRGLLTGEDDKEIYIDGSFDNFVRSSEYFDGLYTDISDQWYAPYAASAYEYGLMKGNEDGAFAPSGNMTVAEALALTARMHNIYYGMDGEFRQGAPWYGVYVGYALERGIIDEDDFDDYERPVTRKEAALLLSAAVDLTELEKINSGVNIPDVGRGDGSYAVIETFYTSGVLTGSGPDGSFKPDDDITRAEMAAIASRLVDPALRVRDGMSE